MKLIDIHVLGHMFSYSHLTKHGASTLIISLVHVHRMFLTTINK